MNQSLNLERLRELLTCLEQLRGMQFSIYRPGEAYPDEGKEQVPFCMLAYADREGGARCRECRRQILQEVWEKREICRKKCHAEVMTQAVPLIRSDRVEAIVMFSFLSDTPDVEEQWKKTREKIFWYSTPARLKAAFEQLPRLSEEDVNACCQLVCACACESSEERQIPSGQRTDMERLQHYISVHYRQHLTLDSIGKALEISKSRLCAIAAASGTTVGRMLTQKRVDEAKILLSSGNMPIRTVAEQVGIADYNYFTKVFRKAVGYTPREFRNSWRRRKETLDNF